MVELLMLMGTISQAFYYSSTFVLVPPIFASRRGTTVVQPVQIAVQSTSSSSIIPRWRFDGQQTLRSMKKLQLTV